MLVRSFDGDLTVRGDGRTVYGYAVPYDTDAEVDDGFGPYVERFTHGAFRNVIKQAHRVRLRTAHDDDDLTWIGHATLLREERKGLFGEWRADDTERGRQAIYKIRDGQLPGMSVGYWPSDKQTHNTLSLTDNGLHRITRTLVKQLDHVCLTDHGAYPNVAPLAVRESAREESSVEHWRKWRAGLTM